MRSLVLLISALFFLGLFVYSIARPGVESFWRSRHRNVFLIAAFAMMFYAGAKHETGRVSYPKTDADIAYLTDHGSYVSNDVIHVDFTRRPIVPDSAQFLIELYALADTNYENCVATIFDAPFSQFTVPSDLSYPAATNFNAVCYTTWTPGPAVQTNGVWHTYWAEAQGTAAAQAKSRGLLWTLPIRTRVPGDGKRIYDCEIEYIELDGNQYINTDSMIKNNSRIKAKFHRTRKYDFQIYFAAMWGTTDSYRSGFHLRDTGSAGTQRNVWNGYQSLNMNCSDDTIEVDIVDCKDVTINGSLVGNLGGPVVSDAKICIGWDAGSVVQARSRKFRGRIYYFQHYVGGKLVMDLIPVRGYNGRGFLYDRISERLFGNSGIGNFILGPVKY